MNIRLWILPLIASLSAALPLAAAAQQGLGMQVFGDDDTAFGLLISNWRDDDTPDLLAPGLTEEVMEPTDAWQLEMQLRARQAIAPLPRPQR